MKLKVAVDPRKCQAYGLCVGIVPHVFDVPAGSPTALLLRSDAGEEERADLEEAARNCPAQAITLTVEE